MSEVEKLQIVDIKRRGGISKKTQKPYEIIEVLDGFTNRLGSTFDKTWAQNWKIGDMIDVKWVKGQPYNGKDQWSIENPNAEQRPRQVRSSGGSSSTPYIIHAYYVAAQLAPHLNTSNTPLTLERIEKLALQVLEKFNKGLKPTDAAENKKTAESIMPQAPVPTPPPPQPAPVPQPQPVVSEEGFDEEEGDDPF